MESKVRARRGSASDRPAPLFSASDVARFCQVDLKTIDNWADKGQIRHSRTRGRHLRFRPLDVLEFLARYGYAPPKELQTLRPRLLIVDPAPASASRVRRALGRRFEVTVFHDPLDALVAVADLDPDLLVVDLDASFDAIHLLERLRALEATKHIRAFGLTRRPPVRAAALAAGAVEVVSADDLSTLRASLERAGGLDRRKA